MEATEYIETVYGTHNFAKIVAEMDANAIMNLMDAFSDTFKVKAEKWESLGKKIERCYVDEEGNELSEESSENIDLCTIGEIAATAYGWL